MLLAQAETAIGPAFDGDDPRRVFPGRGEARISRHDGGSYIADRESVQVENLGRECIEPGTVIGLIPSPESSESMMRNEIRKGTRFLIVATFIRSAVAARSRAVPDPFMNHRGKSMREITSHKDKGLNDSIRIYAIDEPEPGLANHNYEIFSGRPTDPFTHGVRFQQGEYAGGISDESLLAIVADRLQGFQRGPLHCIGNALALTHITEAMKALHQRTADRINRGVEGTSAI